MDTYKIERISKVIHGDLAITGSKSESNRLLLLQQFYSNLEIENLSNSDDTRLMKAALDFSLSKIDIGPAGTAMRFLTAFFAVKEGSKVVLTGSNRMLERPIMVLVDALRMLGANISYLGKEGFPPLEITGSKLKKNHVEVAGNISSQYISALLLIAPNLENGIELRFKGAVTSVPYIKMTLKILSALEIENSWQDDTITVHSKNTIPNTVFTVESDWSSASYFYSMVALSPGSSLRLSSYRKDSLQGDAVLAEIYKNLGVETIFSQNSIELKHTGRLDESKLDSLNLKGAPDIAQTIAVTCLGLGLPCHLTGLHTLKIKETDRLIALKTEIEKLGAKVNITNESLELEARAHLNQGVAISTYEDHRMAMAFAPLALKIPIVINDPNVVSKSYPSFWKDFEKISRK